MTERWDVLVVGAGPAGSAAAALFARQDSPVLLVDAARAPPAECISPGGADILERLRVLERLEAPRPAGEAREIRAHVTRAQRGTLAVLCCFRQFARSEQPCAWYERLLGERGHLSG